MVLVDIDEPAPLRLGAKEGFDLDAEPNELVVRTMPKLVIPERREEGCSAGELPEHADGDAASSSRFRPRLGRLHDVARLRHLRDAQELDPFDVSDDPDFHAAQSHSSAPPCVSAHDGRCGATALRTFL